MLCYIIYRKREVIKIKGKDKVNTMTRAEIKTMIETLEQREFFIWMRDRWTDTDRRMLNDIARQKRELKARLENEVD